MATAVQDVAVLAEERDQREAARLMKDLGARARIVPIDKPLTTTPSERVVIYLSGRDQQLDEVGAFLRRARTTESNLILLCFRHHVSPKLVSEIAFLAGQQLHKKAAFAFHRRDVEQWLASPAAVLDVGIIDSPGADLMRLRRKLGLTQEQLALTLGVSPRTVQNWERNRSTSQMKRKTRDLWELAELIDHYVVTGKESEWIQTKLDAFRGRSPLDLLVEGKIRDLIVEFRRLEEGEPV